MSKEEVRNCIEQVGIIPAIRFSSAEDAWFAVEAISDSGIPIVEVTLTIPGAVEMIRQLAKKDRELIVGAGTVEDVETARRCLDAGAQFLTSPGVDVQVVEFAVKQDVVVFPGAMTPSEVMAAWKAGSDFVKVFPCSMLGGASYIKTLKSPFPNVPLIASGGVTQQTTTDFIQAGAVAVGIGRDLIYPEAVRRRDRDWILELGRRFVKIVNDARTPKAA
jgi:2-dehydro-3-deoxyphosphogluconate aldolase / (4S)-4-hydroxy-2-oxoglutarate aldolase